MIVTIMGDVVSQHGGWVWLGDLVRTLQYFLLPGGSTRVAAYRLVKHDWMNVRKVGRCNYYSFTDTAMKHYEKAEKRIYAAQRIVQSDNWTLAILNLLPDAKKNMLQKNLLWEGFHPLASGIYAHPSSDRASLDAIIREHQVVDDVVVLSVRVEDVDSLIAIKKLVAQRWGLYHLEKSYTNFINIYHPVYRRAQKKLFSPAASFYIRLLLIHSYRCIVLRDPDFPEEMLPANWVGYRAHDLIKNLYQLLATPSIAYITENFDYTSHCKVRVNEHFYRRFGGMHA